MSSIRSIKGAGMSWGKLAVAMNITSERSKGTPR